MHIDGKNFLCFRRDELLIINEKGKNQFNFQKRFKISRAGIMQTPKWFAFYF